MALPDRLQLRGRTTALVRSGARLADGLRHPVPRQPHVGTRLQELLDRAQAQDAEAGRAAWLAHAVEHLVPDEARILDLLAHPPDGDPDRLRGCALIHVQGITGTGLAGESLLENASNVGRAAGVALPELTPWYVGHLRRLDLVETGPEDSRLESDYQALLGDSTVLSALGRAGRDGLTPRVVRHTLRLTPLGHALWEAPTSTAAPRSRDRRGPGSP